MPSVPCGTSHKKAAYHLHILREMLVVESPGYSGFCTANSHSSGMRHITVEAHPVLFAHYICRKCNNSLGKHKNTTPYLTSNAHSTLRLWDKRASKLNSVSTAPDHPTNKNRCFWSSPQRDYYAKSHWEDDQEQRFFVSQVTRRSADRIQFRCPLVSKHMRWLFC